jgi:hypothetical protein
VVVTGDTAPPAISANATLTVQSFSCVAGPMYFNTGSGPQLGKAVSWSLIYGGSAGAYGGKSIVDGTGTLNAATGLLSLSGLPASGAAELRVKDSDGGEYVQQLTVV